METYGDLILDSFARGRIHQLDCTLLVYYLYHLATAAHPGKAVEIVGKVAPSASGALLVAYAEPRPSIVGAIAGLVTFLQQLVVGKLGRVPPLLATKTPLIFPWRPSRVRVLHG